MKIFDYYLPFLASFCLFWAMLGYWASLSFFTKKILFTGSQSLLLISNLLFSLTLVIRWFRESYFPLSNLYESVIFLCWCISSIHLFLERKTKSRLLGSLVAPLLFLLSSFSSLTLPIEMQKALPLVPSLQSNWLMLHVSMMMVSYASLILGSLLSILYLVATTVSWSPTSQNFLKASLSESLDNWSYRIIGLGFPFLTLGIISGAVWANEAWGSYWSWDPKETWALITWLVFATYLHSRINKGWQGKKAATIAALGFFVLWVCYLGVNFLAKGLHSYGWIT
jgi:cytochrome c-type biogenesis protein CcsB